MLSRRVTWALFAFFVLEAISASLSHLPPERIEYPSEYTAYDYCPVDLGVLWCGTTNVFNWMGRGDHITAISTAIISFFTIVLAVIAGKSDKTARIVARTGIRQTRIANRQMLISSKQTDILERQKEIQRQEFLIAHRPKMRVRFVHGPEPMDDSTWIFRAYLANVGDSVATVKSFSFSATAIVDGDESLIEVVPINKGIPPIEVGAGVMMEGTTKDWTSFDSVFTGIIMVHGRMIYEDAVGASRITAFAREKTGMDGRFRVSEKYAADEYED